VHEADIAKRLGLATAVSKSPVDPQGLLEVLEGLSDKEYANATDVSKEFKGK